MRPGEKIQLKPISELMGVVNEESAMDINISEIHSFKEHPFKVSDDEKMKELVDSVKANGVLSPVLLRPDKENGGYEMVSGHRRMHASTLAGRTTVPAIIRELTDDEAVIAMVDANIQREELLPSEKAFAYKMRLEAMKRQAGRPEKNSGQNDQSHLKGLVSRDVLAKQTGESSKQIQRYIRLTELIPEILTMLDLKKIQFTLAVEISYMDKQVQKWLYNFICNNGAIKPNQIAALKEALEKGSIDEDSMIRLLKESALGRNASKKIVLKDKKIRKFFPAYYTNDQIESVIYDLLLNWKMAQEGEQE